MSEVATEYLKFGRVTLGAGQSTTWWYGWWMFNEARVVDFDATPDPGSSGRAVLEVSQYASRETGGGVNYWVTYRNTGSVALSFRPRVAVAPAARWFGGGIS